MPSGPFAHVCILVEDLDRAIDDWTKILEVLDPGQLERQIVRYDDFDGGGDGTRWATFVNDSGSEIQLMEPDPESHLGKRLAKRIRCVEIDAHINDDEFAVCACRLLREMMDLNDH